MRKKFKLEIEVEVGESDVAKLIDSARSCYERNGGATEHPEGESPRDIPPEEAIQSAEDALLELVLANPLLESAGADVVGLSCSLSECDAENGAVLEPNFDPAPESQSDDDQDSDLDEFQPGAYLCRWPNGEFSVVLAETKRDALVALDEWGAAHPSSLTPMETCMLDFGLTDLGEIELRQIGEATADIIWETCYPELREVLLQDGVLPGDGGEYSEEAKEIVRAAVEHERQRLWDNQPDGPSAETEIGRELQQQLGAAGPVADLYVEDIARRLLGSKLGEGGKPN
ncbi:MAG: hypothetical protein HY822_05170 [Acidobacteria bacterium]|nr:hypothetical protein [Acidobacteriota bacterium]